MDNYKICKRCVMDTTCDPNLELDSSGICNYCHKFDEEWKKNQCEVEKESLDNIFAKIKADGKGRQYDCVIGLSGGVDSSYVAYLAKQNGLRVLAVHVDAGWNSELAVQNIENICEKLGYDLHTVVIDWPTMKELQRAYLFSGLANLDVPQDHCFVAAVWHMARKFKVKYILSGYNLSTEGILSNAYQYSFKDWKNIKAVYKKCGRNRISLKKYPHMSFLERYFLMPYVYRTTNISPLNYIHYEKKEAIKLLEKEFGWKYYGGKHYESRFTKFFQEVYLPQKWGWEKRRDHIASLIVGGEMTREEGMAELSIPSSTDEEKRDELEYVLKKLDISAEEWENILELPRKKGTDYKNEQRMVGILKKVKKVLEKLVVSNGQYF